VSRWAGRLLNVLLIVAIFLSLMVASGRALDDVHARAGMLSEGEPLATWRDVSDPARPTPPDRDEAASPSLSVRSSAGRAESLRARWPTGEAMRWRAPKGWLQQAFCIHRHESVDWYRAYTDWAGNPSPYSGGMQFLLSTWRRAGGTGHAYEWRPREQVYRAYVIWLRNGGSWREWGTRGKCGL
jgi:hypothetical protein